jgi:nitroimidazol reductase NimA-like FMN-containing flavoprotein (pyridoxamine 5'-phosphate oxidase superfamily)
MDIIRQNNNVCFEIDCDTKLIDAEKPCSYSYEFKSIIGFGQIIFLETANEKKYGLNRIMENQTDREEMYDFPEEILKKVTVYKIAVEEFTGKQKVISTEK